MIQVTPKHKILLAVEPVDFRRGIQGLAALCQQRWQQDPHSGHLFIFRNRRANALKILVYDGQGFYLIQKKLSQGRFHAWPSPRTPLIFLTPAQLHVLLNNGNPAHVRTPPDWRSIAD